MFDGGGGQPTCQSARVTIVARAHGAIRKGPRYRARPVEIADKTASCRSSFDRPREMGLSDVGALAVADQSTCDGASNRTLPPRFSDISKPKIADQTARASVRRVDIHPNDGHPPDVCSFRV